MEHSKELSSTTVIAFSDCDPFGHLNNARYLDYFINVREQQINEAYDLSLAEWAKKGSGWFIKMNQVAYIKPAKYGERVTLISRLLQFSNVDLHLEMEMLDVHKTQLKAVFWCRLMHINLANGKMAEHPDSLQSLFQAVAYHEPEINLKNFEERVGQIRMKVTGMKKDTAI